VVPNVLVELAMTGSKHHWKRLFGGPEAKWENNIKVDHRKTDKEDLKLVNSFSVVVMGIYNLCIILVLVIFPMFLTF
jgi:hypothetical protein